MAYILLSYYSNDKCSSLLSKGLQRRQFSEVAQNIAMVSEKELAATSGISQRTISRMKPDQILPNPVSEVLISIMRTYVPLKSLSRKKLPTDGLKRPLLPLETKRLWKQPPTDSAQNLHWTFLAASSTESIPDASL